MKVNSSAEITCSTSLPDVLGLYLQRKFHRKSEIVYLSLHQGKVTKNTTAEEFIGRIQVTPNMQGKDGFKFTLRLSLLGLDDTDLYYCRWSHFNLKKESLISTGTIVIVRGKKNLPSQFKRVQKAVRLLPLTYLSSSDAFACRVWSPGAMQGPGFGSHPDYFDCGGIHCHTVPLHWNTDFQIQESKYEAGFVSYKHTKAKGTPLCWV